MAEVTENLEFDVGDAAEVVAAAERVPAERDRADSIGNLPISPAMPHWKKAMGFLNCIPMATASCEVSTTITLANEVIRLSREP